MVGYLLREVCTFCNPALVASCFFFFFVVFFGPLCIISVYFVVLLLFLDDLHHCLYKKKIFLSCDTNLAMEKDASAGIY